MDLRRTKVDRCAWCRYDGVHSSLGWVQRVNEWFYLDPLQGASGEVGEAEQEAGDDHAPVTCAICPGVLECFATLIREVDTLSVEPFGPG